MSWVEKVDMRLKPQALSKGQIVGALLMGAAQITIHGACLAVVWRYTALHPSEHLAWLIAGCATAAAHYNLTRLAGRP